MDLGFTPHPEETGVVVVAALPIASGLVWDGTHAMQVEIQNQCSGFKLISPVYFCDDTVCDMPLNQRVAPNDSTITKFRIDLDQFIFRGAIMYEVRATSTLPNERGINNTMTVTNENAPMSIQLLVAWKISHIGDPRLLIMLLEHGRVFTRNEDGLKQLLKEHSDRFKAMHGREINTWSMRDGTVLRTTMGIMDWKQYRLQITISEGAQDKHTTNPMYYEPKL
jgi:hypothetical protein